jgi:hypothetical protein
MCERALAQRSFEQLIYHGVPAVEKSAALVPIAAEMKKTGDFSPV